MVRTVTNAPPSRDELPDVLEQAKGAGNKVDMQRRSSRAVAYLARMDDGACAEIVREGLVPTLQQWTGSKDPGVTRGALEALGALALDDNGSKLVCNDDFMRQLQALAKAKDKSVCRAAMATLSQMAAADENQGPMAAAGMMEMCVSLAKTKDLGVARWSLQALSNLALNNDNAQKLVDQDLDAVCKMLFEIATKSDDTNVEKYALFCIARLCTVLKFADKCATGNKFPVLFKAANDNIASRKMPAALAIANAADHKDMRIKLVKHKALQLFCEMARVTSGEKTRADMLEYQRIASLGLSKLCATYQIRDLAAKVGALEVVIDMMTSPLQDVRRSAAVATSELTLHEDNARKMCMAGVIKPLLDMARSGDRFQENDAIQALSNLAISEENQKQLLKEGGQHALKYLELSTNPTVVKLSKKLQTRMRIAKLRAAARLAGRIAKGAKDKGLVDEDGNVHVPEEGSGRPKAKKKLSRR